MKKFIFLILAFLLGAVNLYSQGEFISEGAYHCSQKKIHNPNYIMLSPLSQNSPRHSYDMLDTKMSIDLYNNFKTPYPRNFKANIIDKFRVDSTLNNIKMNAVNTSLGIDSVRLYPSNTTLAFTQVSDVLTITLDRTYNPGEIVYVKIYYRHLAIADNAFYCGNGGVFTDAEPEGARHWFPCWDKPSDKATYDMTIKVPANVRIGSNGRLNDSTLTGDTLYYHWISRDPISTYLVVMTGKVNYNMTVVYWHKISNPNDSVPMRYYWNAGENPSADINSVGDLTTFYSQKFGEYPFEKGGFTTAPASGFTWGGMENQTLITYCPGCWVSYTSHEYAHMWFGDMITCATWADIWINEGFATYCEALYIEHTTGYSAYKSEINSDASYYLSYNPGWAISVPSWETTTPDVNTLFNFAITYEKGACILHMLRYVLGDTVFFNALHTYGTDTTNFKYKTARIQDFNAMWNTYTGQNLDWFFNEWIYQPNHPVYANTYNITNVGGGQWRVKFYANQTQSNTPFHIMPITLKISFTTGSDTTIRVMNDVNNQLFVYDFFRQPTTLVFDPNNDIVLKTATLTTIPAALTVYIEGFWNGNTQVSDTVKVYLANTTTPFAFVDSAKVLLSATGTASLSFTNAASGNYYIVVRHRNHLETWSKLPQAITTGVNLNYDFTTSAAQSYGNNMMQVGSVWVLFGGDINQDGIIDALDRSVCWNDRNLIGYYATDVNGDGTVDALDRSICWNNRNLSVQKPALIALPGKVMKQYKKGK